MFAAQRVRKKIRLLFASLSLLPVPNRYLVPICCRRDLRVLVPPCAFFVGLFPVDFFLCFSGALWGPGSCVARLPFLSVWGLVLADPRARSRGGVRVPFSAPRDFAWFIFFLERDGGLLLSDLVQRQGCRCRSCHRQAAHERPRTTRSRKTTTTTCSLRRRRPCPRCW